MTRATSMISAENFPPQKWQNLPFAPPAGYPGPELAVALINDLPMYIFRRSLRPLPHPPPHTLRQIYEAESTDCAGKNIPDHRPASAIFHDSRHSLGFARDGVRCKINEIRSPHLSFVRSKSLKGKLIVSRHHRYYKIFVRATLRPRILIIIVTSRVVRRLVNYFVLSSPSIYIRLKTIFK